MRKWKPMPRHPGIYSYDTSRGVRYGVRRSFKNSEGKRDEYTKSSFAHWREAEADLKKFEASLVTGRINPITHRSITFDQYFEMLQERKVKTGLWRPSTVRTKNHLYNALVKPSFGTRRLASVTRLEYQAFIDQLIEKDYAHNSIVAVNSMVMQILNDAEKLDVIDKNRLRGSSVKGGAAPRPVSLSREDYRTWIQTAENTLDDYDFAMVMLLTLGPRREEVYGLQLKSFVKETGLNDQPYYQIRYYKARTSAELNGGPLKSDAAYRVNYARSQQLVHLIDAAIAECKRRSVKNSRIPGPDTFLFLSDKGTPVYLSYMRERIFHPISLATHIAVRPHMLRHYFATQAMQTGEAESTIMHWLGHSDISMTASYTRATKEGALQLIDTLDEPLNPDA